MTHVYQRHGVRVVSFNKSGHKSIVQGFMTMPDGQDSAKMVLGTLHGGMRQGHHQPFEDWPTPIVTLAYFRHPLARVAAVWNHLFRDRAGYTPLLKFGFTEDMIFREFVRHLLTIEENDEMDLHLMPQSRAFNRCVGDTVTTEIYRLDQIATQWPKMCATWGLQCRREPFHYNDRSQNYPNGKPWTYLWHDLESEATDLLNGLYHQDLDTWSAWG